MTAAAVDGLSVIATERVESPLSSPERPMFYVHTLKLLLEDGSVVYGCSDCDFTSDKMGSTRNHWQNYCPGNPKSITNGGVKKPRKDRRVNEAEDLAALLDQLLDDNGSQERIASLEREVADLEQWGIELGDQVKSLKEELDKERRAVGQWRRRAEFAETQIVGIRKVLRDRGRVS